MNVNVLYFASIRDLTGKANEEIDLPDDAPLKTLIDELVGRYPRLADMRASLMVSVNQEYAEDGSSLSDGDEVALIPPVSGGSGAGRSGDGREVCWFTPCVLSSE